MHTALYTAFNCILYIENLQHKDSQLHFHTAKVLSGIASVLFLLLKKNEVKYVVITQPHINGKL